MQFILKLFLLDLINTGTAQKFQFNTFIIPHPDKVDKGGEDAQYTNSRLIAVADGVGGWNNQGVDPALYSKKLISNIEQFQDESDIRNLMEKAANYTYHIKGSSTLIIVRLLDDLKIEVLNIGDCGYLIMRDGHVIHQSLEQQHSFNYPFQLGGLGHGDRVSDAQYFQHQLQEGDIIIVGSDGLFDNLFDNHIQEEVVKNGYTNDLAKVLARKAFQYSLKKKYYSPFAKRAKDYGYQHNSGKSDDITVVVAKIVIQQDDL